MKRRGRSPVWDSGLFASRRFDLNVRVTYNLCLLSGLPSLPAFRILYNQERF